MKPLYTPDNVTPAYQLNWGLTIFWRQAPIPDNAWLAPLKDVTEPDGVRILKHQFTTGDSSQFFISTKPHVSPSRTIWSVKGRLQNLVRRQRPQAFQRNYCVRSIGSVTRAVIEQYVANQLARHPTADPDVQQRLARFQRTFPDVDLSQPVFSAHGEYWYNLHLVIVNEERWREIREEVWQRLSDTIDAVAVKYGHRLSRVGLLPDHIHLTMGCPIERSPEDIALSFVNNLAYACGMKPMFKYGYYVGTFGEYDRGAVL